MSVGENVVQWLVVGSEVGRKVTTEYCTRYLWRDGNYILAYVRPSSSFARLDDEVIHIYS